MDEKQHVEVKKSRFSQKVNDKHIDSVMDNASSSPKSREAVKIKNNVPSKKSSLFKLAVEQNAKKQLQNSDKSLKEEDGEWYEDNMMSIEVDDDTMHENERISQTNIGLEKTNNNILEGVTNLKHDTKSLHPDSYISEDKRNMPTPPQNALRESPFSASNSRRGAAGSYFSNSTNKIYANNLGSDHKNILQEEVGDSSDSEISNMDEVMSQMNRISPPKKQTGFTSHLLRVSPDIHKDKSTIKVGEKEDRDRGVKVMKLVVKKPRMKGRSSSSSSSSEIHQESKPERVYKKETDFGKLKVSNLGDRSPPIMPSDMREDEGMSKKEDTGTIQPDIQDIQAAHQKRMSLHATSKRKQSEETPGDESKYRRKIFSQLRNKDSDTNGIIEI